MEIESIKYKIKDILENNNFENIKVNIVKLFSDNNSNILLIRKIIKILSKYLKQYMNNSEFLISKYIIKILYYINKNKIIDNDKKYVVINYILIYKFYKKIDSTKKCLVILNKAIDYSKDNAYDKYLPELYLKIAKILQKLDINISLNYLKKGLKYNKNNKYIYKYLYHKGKIYYDMKKYNKAVKNFNKYVDKIKNDNLLLKYNEKVYEYIDKCNKLLEIINKKNNKNIQIMSKNKHNYNNLLHKSNNIFKIKQSHINCFPNLLYSQNYTNFEITKKHVINNINNNIEKLIPQISNNNSQTFINQEMSNIESNKSSIIINNYNQNIDNFLNNIKEYKIKNIIINKKDEFNKKINNIIIKNKQNNDKNNLENDIKNIKNKINQEIDNENVINIRNNYYSELKSYHKTYKKSVNIISNYYYKKIKLDLKDNKEIIKNRKIIYFTYKYFYYNNCYNNFKLIFYYDNNVLTLNSYKLNINNKIILKLSFCKKIKLTTNLVSFVKKTLKIIYIHNDILFLRQNKDINRKNKQYRDRINAENNLENNTYASTSNMTINTNINDKVNIYIPLKIKNYLAKKLSIKSMINKLKNKLNIKLIKKFKKVYNNNVVLIFFVKSNDNIIISNYSISNNRSYNKIVKKYVDIDFTDEKYLYESILIAYDKMYIRNKINNTIAIENKKKIIKNVIIIQKYFRYCLFRKIVLDSKLFKHKKNIRKIVLYDSKIFSITLYNNINKYNHSKVTLNIVNNKLLNNSDNDYIYLIKKNYINNINFIFNKIFISKYDNNSQYYLYIRANYKDNNDDQIKIFSKVKKIYKNNKLIKKLSYINNNSSFEFSIYYYTKNQIILLMVYNNNIESEDEQIRIELSKIKNNNILFNKELVLKYIKKIIIANIIINNDKVYFNYNNLYTNTIFKYKNNDKYHLDQLAISSILNIKQSTNTTTKTQIIDNKEEIIITEEDIVFENNYSDNFLKYNNINTNNNINLFKSLVEILTRSNINLFNKIINSESFNTKYIYSWELFNAIYSVNDIKDYYKPEVIIDLINFFDFKNGFLINKIHLLSLLKTNDKNNNLDYQFKKEYEKKCYNNFINIIEYILKNNLGDTIYELINKHHEIPCFTFLNILNKILSKKYNKNVLLNFIKIIDSNATGFINTQNFKLILLFKEKDYNQNIRFNIKIYPNNKKIIKIFNNSPLYFFKNSKYKFININYILKHILSYKTNIEYQTLYIVFYFIYHIFKMFKYDYIDIYNIDIIVKCFILKKYDINIPYNNPNNDIILNKIYNNYISNNNIIINKIKNIILNTDTIIDYILLFKIITKEINKEPKELLFLTNKLNELYIHNFLVTLIN